MPQPPAKPFSGIFVCYRREDSSGHAGRLSDRLVEHFGKDRIFMDIDTIEPGEDFVTVIENAVGSCEILIAIIGRHWLSSTGESPGWLDNPNDFVRLEITTALSRDIRVIPVLVQRASMPKPKDLPADLAKLTRRNAVELSDLRWQNDVDQLISVMEKVLVKREEARRRAQLLLTESGTTIRAEEPYSQKDSSASALTTMPGSPPERPVNNLEQVFPRGVTIGTRSGRTESAGSKRTLTMVAGILFLIVAGGIGIWLGRGTSPTNLGLSDPRSSDNHPGPTATPSVVAQPANSNEQTAPQGTASPANANTVKKPAQESRASASPRKRTGDSAQERRKRALDALKSPL